jgi:PUA-domain protein
MLAGSLTESMVLRLRRRTRLRRKEALEFVTRLNDTFGMAIPADDVPMDEAEAGSMHILFRGGEPLAFVTGTDLAPTIRGLLAFPAQRRHVTVDMGAVPFVYNGADVMAPGIVDADLSIRPGDVVWVRDEKNRRPLAVGKALMDGPTMAREERGKAIETLHHVGDDIWRIGEEET